MYTQLKEHLSNDILLLEGGWIKRDSNYENELCDLFFFDVDKSRHWDARWNNFFIELKKGKSIWLDLVRYSELIIESRNNINPNLVNLFIIPDKSKESIKEIVCVTTIAIIGKLNLTVSVAEDIIKISKVVPRSLNAQASLTVNDVKSICEFWLEY